MQIALGAKAKIPGAVTEIKPLDVFYPAVRTLQAARTRCKCCNGKYYMSES
jgi:hypothetical protein